MIFFSQSSFLFVPSHLFHFVGALVTEFHTNTCLILYHVYYAFMPSITYIWTIFVNVTFSKSIIFRECTFEPYVFKLVIKTIFISSSPFALLIINVKILSNFQKEWCTFGEKRTFETNKDYPFLKFECFEHAKTFLICVKLWACKLCKLMENIPIFLMIIKTIMFPLWYFKHTKM